MIQKIDLLNLEKIEDIYVRENFRRLRQLLEEIQTGGGSGGQFTFNAETVTQLLESAGLWQPLTLSIPAGATRVLDSIPYANFHMVKYVSVLYNLSAGVSRGFELSVYSVGGLPKDVLGPKGGSPVNCSIVAATNGTNMDVAITNNEIYQLELTAAKLLL